MLSLTYRSEMGFASVGFIVAVVSQKGGVGKSTIARALATEAGKGGLSVKVVDMDTQQGTFMDWYQKRLDLGRADVCSVEYAGSVEKALGFVQQYDLLVIDAPARSSKATLELAKSADVVIQPTGTGRDDVRPAVLLFYELEKEKVPKERLFFVLSRVGTQAEEEEAREYLEETGFSVLPGSLVEKATYRQSQSEGLSITETRYKTLNEKAKEITNFIFGLLEK